MNNPFDFFDKIYCVNLPQSTDRWSVVSKEFEKIGILNRVERIWASPPKSDFKMNNLLYPPGEFGVWLSQVKALSHSMNNQDKNYLLFEDDVAFLTNALDILTESLKIIPDNWDIFYIGGRPEGKLKQINNSLARTDLFFGGYAYAVNAKSFSRLFDAQFDNISKTFPASTCDATISKFGKENNGYCTIPALCKNVPGKSVIRNSHRNYDGATHESWKKYLPK